MKPLRFSRFAVVFAGSWLFAAIVEQATGRRVRSYVSDTDLAENVSIDVFLLGASLADMSGFEVVGESEGSGGS